MDKTFHDATIAAAVHEMDRALSDPDVRVDEHVQDMLVSVGISNDGTIGVDLTVGGMPGFAFEGEASARAARGTALTLHPVRAPGVLAFHAHSRCQRHAWFL